MAEVTTARADNRWAGGRAGQHRAAGSPVKTSAWARLVESEMSLDPALADSIVRIACSTKHRFV